MDVYRQAASIVEQVGKGQGTAKALCLKKHIQKKKQTYAVVCETIRNLDRIKRILKDAEFFEYFPQLLADGDQQSQQDKKESEPEKKHQHMQNRGAIKFDPRFLIYCMTYDHIYGKGVNTKQHPAAKALTESKEFLFKADSRLPKLIPRSAAEKRADEEAFASEEQAQQLEQQQEKEENGRENTIAYSFPRYARINRLMFTNEATTISNEEVLARLQKQNFRRSGVAIRRERNEEIDRRNAAAAMAQDSDLPPDFNLEEVAAAGNGEDEHDDALDKEVDLSKPRIDQHVPGLIVFPPGTDIHAHPLVKQGKLLLQDKASCLPAAILCDLVPNDATKQVPLEGFGYLVDGCSAPGNKTSQLVEYTASNYYQNISNTPTVAPGDDASAAAANNEDAAAETTATKEFTPTQIIAVERDPSRFKLLQKRMEQLTKGSVDCRKGSFESIFEQGENDYVGAILLDPSCSSSGVLSRIDQQMKKKLNVITNNNNENGQEGDENNNNDSENAEDKAQNEEHEKVKELAAEQLALLTHAMTAFPNCKRVVYSTCSIHQEENENVVLRALAAANKFQEGLGKKKQRKQGKWRVTCIMPDGKWVTRGRFVEEEASEEMKSSLPFTKEEMDQISANCIRCDPFSDKTSGFFVARFDRIPRAD